MTFFIEFDWFIGIGLRWVSAEYWRMLVLHLPFISFAITFPNIEYDENCEEECEVEERRRQ